MRVQCSTCLELLTITLEDDLTSTPCGQADLTLAETDGETQQDPNDLPYESMSPSATVSVEVKSAPISSCLYEIIYGEDEVKVR